MLITLIAYVPGEQALPPQWDVVHRWAEEPTMATTKMIATIKVERDIFLLALVRLGNRDK